jgi:hypothetical protein
MFSPESNTIYTDLPSTPIEQDIDPSLVYCEVIPGTNSIRVSKNLLVKPLAESTQKDYSYETWEKDYDDSIFGDHTPFFLKSFLNAIDNDTLVKKLFILGQKMFKKQFLIIIQLCTLSGFVYSNTPPAITFNSATTAPQLTTLITGKTAAELATALANLTDDRLLALFSLATGTTLTTLKNNVPAARHANLLILGLTSATTALQLTTLITGKTAAELATALASLTDDRLLALFSLATGTTLTTLKNNVPAARHANLLALALTSATPTTQLLTNVITGRTATEVATTLTGLTDERLAILSPLATGAALKILKDNIIIQQNTRLLALNLSKVTTTQELTTLMRGKNPTELSIALTRPILSPEVLARILSIAGPANLELFKNKIPDKKLAQIMIKDLFSKHEQTSRDIPIRGQNLQHFNRLKETLQAIQTAIDNDNIAEINTMITELQGDRYFNWEQGVYNNRNIVITGYPNNYGFLSAKINQYRKEADKVFLGAYPLITLMKNAPKIQ